MDGCASSMKLSTLPIPKSLPREGTFVASLRGYLCCFVKLSLVAFCGVVVRPIQGAGAILPEKLVKVPGLLHEKLLLCQTRAIIPLKYLFLQGLLIDT